MTKRPLFALALAGIAGLLLAAPAASAAVHEVRIQPNPKFDPAEITIRAGDTVKWIAEVNGHTVTSGANGQADGTFDESVSTTNPFQFTFGEVGTFPYFCRPHSSFMRGTVVVEAAPTESSTRATSEMIPVTDTFPTSTSEDAEGDPADGGDGTPSLPVALVILVAAAVAALGLRRRQR